MRWLVRKAWAGPDWYVWDRDGYFHSMHVTWWSAWNAAQRAAQREAEEVR